MRPGGCGARWNAVCSHREPWNATTATRPHPRPTRSASAAPPASKKVSRIASLRAARPARAKAPTARTAKSRPRRIGRRATSTRPGCRKGGARRPRLSRVALTSLGTPSRIGLRGGVRLSSLLSLSPSPPPPNMRHDSHHGAERSIRSVGGSESAVIVGAAAVPSRRRGRIALARSPEPGTTPCPSASGASRSLRHTCGRRLFRSACCLGAVVGSAARCSYGAGWRARLQDGPESPRARRDATASPRPPGRGPSPASRPSARRRPGYRRGSAGRPRGARSPRR